MKTEPCAFLLASLTACMACAASAQPLFETPWYGGLGLGISNLEPDTDGTAYSLDDKRDHGWLVYAGYDWSNRWSFEGHYADLGKAQLSPNGEISYQVFGLSALYYFYHRYPHYQGLRAYAKAGLGKMNNKTEVNFERVNDVHLHYGAGLEYGFGNGLALRTELALIDQDAQSVSISLLKRLGGRTRPAPVAEAVPLELDGDHDGVADQLDACPNTLAGVAVNAAGCELDLDNDGSADSKDQCPDTPEGISVDAAGCEPDSDRDGVIDSKDECPNSLAGNQIDHVGCDIQGVIILKGVHFETRSARLREDSKTVLDDIATTLQRYPQMVVEVAGYTDSLGSKARNKKLSQDRAESVAGYLVDKGVNKERLHAKGYGPADPIADNVTEVGRAANRRVELHILKH